MNIKEQLIDSWILSSKVTLFLLGNMEAEWLQVKLNGKGRSIGEQFLHINNIRSFWIGKVDQKIDLKIEKKYAKNKEYLYRSLTTSASKMGETLLKILIEEKISGYKPHPFAFYSQMIAHEAHHRGQIMLTITQNELPIEKSVNFGLWNWNNK